MDRITRFRADPRHIRTFVRKDGDQWLVGVEPRGAPSLRISMSAPRAEIIEDLMIDLLELAEEQEMVGIDLGMDWAYDHPQCPRGSDGEQV